MMSKQSISEESTNNIIETPRVSEPKRRAGEIYYKFGSNGKVKKVEKLLKIVKEATCVCEEEEENEYRQESIDDELSRTDSEESDANSESVSCDIESVKLYPNTTSEHFHNSTPQKFSIK